MVMPAGVWHAVENVGTEEAIMINFPTRPYNHADPDKRRLPIDSPEIPFEF
jgi:dTDP-4-dehydrorhamnose 3,5-epimerase